ncbi:hypothetical protein JCM10003_1401 [Bacteroides pyogenes JCM 10003]|nr:hypothetical protein JCM10003_1401 [Bacteroides pyogenes JCM 10003]
MSPFGPLGMVMSTSVQDVAQPINNTLIIDRKKVCLLLIFLFLNLVKFSNYN